MSECWEFVETGDCGHTDAEHDAMADEPPKNVQTEGSDEREGTT